MITPFFLGAIGIGVTVGLGVGCGTLYSTFYPSHLMEWDVYLPILRSRGGCLFPAVVAGFCYGLPGTRCVMGCLFMRFLGFLGQVVRPDTIPSVSILMVFPELVLSLENGDFFCLSQLLLSRAWVYVRKASVHFFISFIYPIGKPIFILWIGLRGVKKMACELLQSTA